MKKTDPIPTKLDETDADWLDLLCRRTGLKRSEAIRRAVRLLATEASARPKWNWVQETANPMPPLDSKDVPADFAEANARAKAQADDARQRHPRRSRS